MEITTPVEADNFMRQTIIGSVFRKSLFVAFGLACGFAFSSTSAAESTSSSAAKEKPQSTQGPVVISMPKPQYPFEMRRKGIQGDVWVEFMIDAEGNVHDAKVISAPHTDLHAPALTAIEHAKFKPAMKEGRPVPVRMRLPFVFKL